MSIAQFICSSINKHMGYFQLLATVNHAATNTVRAFLSSQQLLVSIPALTQQSAKCTYYQVGSAGRLAVWVPSCLTSF